MITLKIQETNNTLKFKEHCEPVVCGNSNYTVEFEFGEDWQSVNSKVAVLDLAGLKTAINFDGNILALPPLDAPPSAKTLELYLMSAETEIKTLITNTIVLDIIPTHHIQNLPAFEPIETHVSALLKKFDALADGSLKLATSKHAETADLANNVSNPNLLINGDFKVNQRGETTYTEAGKYTVDRWRLVGGSVEVVENGIKLNGTIVQKLEHSPSMQVVASSNAGTISYSNGAVTLSTTTATIITYAKLEVGTTATPFSPRSYAEELAMCQRYYWKWKSANRNNSTYGELGFGVLSSTTVGFINISIPTTMRIIPTLKSSVEEFVIRNNETYKQVSEINIWTYNGGYVILRCTSQNEFDATWTNISLRPNNSSTAYLEFDAEIY